MLKNLIALSRSFVHLASHSSGPCPLSYSKCNLITSIQVSIQPPDWSLYDFGFLSALRDLSPLSVDFESLVINVSRDLFNGSNIEAYIVVLCETVIKSGFDLTRGPWASVPPMWHWLLAKLDLSSCPQRGYPVVRLKTRS